MSLKINWTSRIVGSKFTVFALFLTLYLRAIFQVKAPGGLIFGGGDLTEGLLCYRIGGLYTWTGLFSEFYGSEMDGFALEQIKGLKASTTPATKTSLILSPFGCVQFTCKTDQADVR